MTCKSLEKPSCIDLFLTISNRSFQNIQTIATGLSDFYKLEVRILKMYLTNTNQNLWLTKTYMKQRNLCVSLLRHNKNRL